MIVAAKIDEVHALRWAKEGLSWGLVPTMGFLHEGHISLVRRAIAENDRVAVSIYVNPTQFAPNEDLASYPRDQERDLALLAAEKVDLVFVPADTVMYPAGFQTSITINKVSRPLEGNSRRTHFDGVATIVTKLFNIVQPTRAYFGQKDAQQAIVLNRMVRDLNFKIELVFCPIVREADGLAMSSRNKYLSGVERPVASILFHALSQAQEAYLAGERDGRVLRRIMTEILSAEPLAQIDYVSAADSQTLEELDQFEGGILLSMAVFFGKTRLIDNILIEQ